MFGISEGLLYFTMLAVSANHKNLIEVQFTYSVNLYMYTYTVHVLVLTLGSPWPMRISAFIVYGLH